jgi:hypothetical protein
MRVLFGCTLQGVGAVTEQHHRTECLWLKPGMLIQDSLWEGTDDFSCIAA